MNLTINSTQPAVALSQPKAPAAPAQPAAPAKDAASTLVTDSVVLSGRPKTKDALHEGVRLESKAYAKAGAIGGAIAGGLAVPLVTFALTMGAPLQNSKLLWGSVAAGVVGGAAIGGVGGYVRGAASGAIDGLLVSTANNKTQAAVITAVVSGGLSIAGAAMKGKLTPQAGISAVVAAGIGAYAGGKIYEGALERQAAREAKAAK